MCGKNPYQLSFRGPGLLEESAFSSVLRNSRSLAGARDDNKRDDFRNYFGATSKSSGHKKAVSF
jgi:hypothetical protein